MHLQHESHHRTGVAICEHHRVLLSLISVVRVARSYVVTVLNTFKLHRPKPSATQTSHLSLTDDAMKLMFE